jgi:hypothetical protein
MTARAGHRCGLSYRALRDPPENNDCRVAFSCFRPVILLLFAAPASKKARKYGVISAAACIFSCYLRGAAGATLELMGLGTRLVARGRS